MDRRQHIQADDLEGEESEGKRQDSEAAKVNRPDLRVAESPEQVNEEASGVPRQPRHWDPVFIVRRADLDLSEDVLITRHGRFLALAPHGKV